MYGSVLSQTETESRRVVRSVCEWPPLQFTVTIDEFHGPYATLSVPYSSRMHCSKVDREYPWLQRCVLSMLRSASAGLLGVPPPPAAAPPRT